jgi:integrin beta 3
VISIPVIVDRGVWKSQKYEPGDAVTWRGSLWICKAETESKPNDVAEHWRLAVKRGRDGKDSI